MQPTDVADSATCRALVEDTAVEFGAIDVVVTMPAGPCGRASTKRSRGRIVAVSSMAGLIGVPERTAYAASKHAVTGFFDSLRIELAGSGVSVTLVHPDFVVSEIHRRALGVRRTPTTRAGHQSSACNDRSSWSRGWDTTAAACRRGATVERRRAASPADQCISSSVKRKYEKKWLMARIWSRRP